MKQKALDYMKANIGAFYEKYYREKNNLWVKDLFDYDPFEVFMDIPDFELMPLTNKKGEVDIDGRMDSYFYSEQRNSSAKGESFFSRLFR